MLKQKTRTKLMKNNFFKYSLFGVLSLMLISGATAVWTYNFQASTGFIVTGGEDPFIYTSDFSIDSVDVTLVPLEKIETLTIQNLNGQQLMQVGFTKTIVDVATDSCNPEGDYTFELYIVERDRTLLNGDLFAMTAGETINLIATSNLLQGSCPQEVFMVVSLTPTE